MKIKKYKKPKKSSSSENKEQKSKLKLAKHSLAMDIKKLEDVKRYIEKELKHLSNDKVTLENLKGIVSSYANLPMIADIYTIKEDEKEVDEELDDTQLESLGALVKAEYNDNYNMEDLSRK